MYLQYSTRQEIVNSTRSVEQGGNVLLVSLENLLVGAWCFLNWIAHQHVVAFACLCLQPEEKWTVLNLLSVQVPISPLHTASFVKIVMEVACVSLLSVQVYEDLRSAEQVFTCRHSCCSPT